MDTENAAVVRALYEASRCGDAAAIAGLIHPDVHVAEPASLPYGGEWLGSARFYEFMGALDAAWDGFDFDINELLDAGPYVIGMVTMRGTCRSNGRSVETPIAEFFTVKDGKIASFRPYYWDTAAVMAVRSADPE